jgi:hypothetical protein
MQRRRVYVKRTEGDDRQTDRRTERLSTHESRSMQRDEMAGSGGGGAPVLSRSHVPSTYLPTYS